MDSLLQSPSSGSPVYSQSSELSVSSQLLPVTPRFDLNLLTLTMPPTANNYVLFLAVLLGGVLLIRHLRGKRLPLPPGPFRWPIIGSALQVPKTYAWLTYSKWAKTYGESTTNRSRTAV